MIANVNQDTCIGCELCPSICPDIFEMKDDKAVAKNISIAQSIKETAIEARDNCPVAAINITDN
jgi:ferredoxin